MKSKYDFWVLLKPLYGKLNCFALSRTRSRDRAKDLVSETVLRAYDSFDKLKSEKAFLSYLFSIAVRVNISNHRKSSYIEYDESVDYEELFADNISPEDAADLNILYAACDELPKVQSDVFFHYEILGFSQKEIAKIFDISLFNVKIRLHRARKNLRLKLGDNSSDIISTQGELR
ncbi:MAG: RNA polymerase sigma factor [Chlorobi bacterium]|nr:RNA polymerase sigma factor [Chlorobiota bacterium]